MSKFIRHIPCPRCGSRDNCGEYDDHFWCFGCKYYKPKNDITAIRTRLRQSELNQNSGEFTLNLVDDIPPKAMKWLLQFGISLQEIKDFNIKWEPDQELLVLISKDNYYQARCFGNHRTKYLSKGIKPLTYFGYSDKLVCVEDVLSAIKISRLSPEFCAVPLLGCSISNEWIQSISNKFKEVVIWLDRDKAKDAVKISRDLRQRGFVSRVVISPLDPKEYSKGELIEWLKKE